MSINKKADFIKNYDEELSSGAYEQKFLASNIKYDAINDNNNNNYNLNIVNFNSLTSTGISPNTLQAWHQAYIEIPMDVTLEISSATASQTVLTTAQASEFLKFDRTDADYGISIKSNVHLFDMPTIKWSDVAISTNTNYNNFYRSLEMLSWDEEKLKIHGPLMNVRLDNGESIELIEGVGEVNGKIRTKLTADLLTNPLELNRSLNMAQYERCRYLNYKIADNDGYNRGLLSNIDTRRIGGLNSASTDTKLMYSWITRTPLSAIHDFFDKIPTTGAVNSFDLKFNLNCGPSSKWKVKYEADLDKDPSDNIVVKSIYPIEIDNSAMGNAHTCPFLLSELGFKTGLNLASVANKKITAKGTYQFWVTISTEIGSKTNAHIPCQIFLPTISYDTSISKSILSQGSVPVYYTDYLIEEQRNSKGVSDKTLCNINRTFNNQYVKVNKLYIIPILSVQNRDLNIPGNKLFDITSSQLIEPYNSPLSSCPNTFNPGVKLYDLQLRVGTVPVYAEPIRSEAEFYNQTALSYFAERGDANILQSAVNATQLTLDKFRCGYGVYCLDLVHTTDKVSWASPKTYHISFKYDSPYDLDLIYIFEQQKSVMFDRTLGAIVQSE